MRKRSRSLLGCSETKTKAKDHSFVFRPQPSRRAAVNATGRVGAVLVQFGYRLNKPLQNVERNNILPRHRVCACVPSQLALVLLW